MSNYKIGIGVFAYNRVNSLKKCLSSLPKIYPIVVFVDYPKDIYSGIQNKKILDYLEEFLLNNPRMKITIIKRSVNMGGPRGIPLGIDLLSELHDYFFIIEDDVILSANFIKHSTDLIERGFFEKFNIFGICASNVPYILCKNRDYSVISGYFNCWGWVGSSKNWKERSRIEFNKININEVIKKALPFASKGSLKFWKKEFNYQLEGVKYNWDARFMFDVWVSGGFFLYLPGNYSSNIGVNATSQNNTKARRFNYLEIKTNQNKVSCEVGRVSKGFDTCVQKIIYLSIYRRIKLAITLKGWFF